jgi:hypothetical protein
MLGGEAAEAAVEPHHVGFVLQVLEGAISVVRQRNADQAAVVGVVDFNFGHPGKASGTKPSRARR